MDHKEWYLEYTIHMDRPGLLGDIASLLGMLGINIITINGVEKSSRGMLLGSDGDDKIVILGNLLKQVSNITVTALRPPKLVDRLAIRHGRYIERDVDDKKTFRFTRDELGLLVDFMAELFKKEGHQLIGIRGMPRVGKTESIVAASVSANKRWTFISSTLLRQTVRKQLAEDELSADHVYLIDGVVSTRSSEKHHMLMREVIRLPATKVIEHPDIFMQETEFTLDDFRCIIELRNHPDEEISYDIVEHDISDFDLP